MMDITLHRIDELEKALIEAMKVRHFCCMEGCPEDVEHCDPYKFDKYLQRWAEVLGHKVVSNWPNP